MLKSTQGSWQNFTHKVSTKLSLCDTVWRLLLLNHNVYVVSIIMYQHICHLDMFSKWFSLICVCLFFGNSCKLYVFYNNVFAFLSSEGPFQLREVVCYRVSLLL